jgi:hypothetical protein
MRLPTNRNTNINKIIKNKVITVENYHNRSMSSNSNKYSIYRDNTYRAMLVLMLAIYTSNICLKHSFCTTYYDRNNRKCFSVTLSTSHSHKKLPLIIRHLA